MLKIGFSMWVAMWFLVMPQAIWAGEVHVAVASNFLSPLKKIARSYKQDTGNRLILISGSTGKLYAQVRNGAPFDVLLAADDKRPELLEKEGVGIKRTRFTYAVGTLVLWSPDPVDVRESLIKMKNGKLAIANPKTAPYGKAAQQVLERMGLWKKMRPFLVQGENIAQTLQFVATGNAKLGFVASSQLEDPKLELKGSQWQVPFDQYEPILQQAVLLKPGLSNSFAQQFLEFMRGSTAKKIMRSYGYRFIEE